MYPDAAISSIFSFSFIPFIPLSLCNEFRSSRLERVSPTRFFFFSANGLTNGRLFLFELHFDSIEINRNWISLGSLGLGRTVGRFHVIRELSARLDQARGLEPVQVIVDLPKLRRPCLSRRRELFQTFRHREGPSALNQ